LRRSDEKILTTHVGSLPFPTFDSGLAIGDGANLKQDVATVVQRQRDLGMDVINEGEYTKGGDWLRYMQNRFAGFADIETPAEKPLIEQGKDREAFSEFQAPALHLVAKGRDSAKFWELKSRSNEEMAAAGRDLARINAALELKLKSMDDVRRENVRLRDITRYKDTADYLSVVARVATRDSSSWWQRIVIRKGRNDGIRPGSPVIFGITVVPPTSKATNKTVSCS
jgi:hypothetical protein